MEQRICTRCLIREMVGTEDFKESEMKMIEKYRDAIKQADRVSDKEYEQRLAVCKECEKLTSGTCGACGCYVELRAAAKVSHCPHKKW